MGSTGQSWSNKRWSADTEIAFLLALRLTGGVRAACAEIGRSVEGAYARRKREPDFAARWQQVIEEQHRLKIAAEKARLEGLDAARATGALTNGTQADEGTVPNRVRFDGWTPLRQRAFLRALAETGKIEKACRLAGISKTAAQNMRDQHPSFAAAWDRALAKAQPTLEQIAVERAIDGVTEPVYHGGKIVGHRQRYSDSLMREVLRREALRLGLHDTKGDLVAVARAAAKAAGGEFSTPAEEADTNAAILRKLDAIDRRRAAAALAGPST